MERIYYLNGVETPLDEILEYIKNALLYDGQSCDFESLGIDFEDIEINDKRN